jgi:type I restriction enzyme S subunit
MKKGWEIKKLGDVCDVIGGGTPSKGNIKFYDGNIFWATVRDMKGDFINETEHKITEAAVKESSTNIIPKGNVVIATRVGLGKICLVENDTAINQDLRGVIPKRKTDLSVGYLFQWFKSISHQIVEEGTGATVQGVKLPFIKGLEIPLPPLPEQQRIVALLDEAFAAIAKAKANAEQNLKNAKELFESYLQGVFENKGEGWEENILKDVCELKSGTTISPSLERTEGDVLYTKVGDMNLPDNEVEINTSSRFVNSREIKINQIIPEGAIIFPKRGGAIATNKKRKIIKPTIVDLNTMAIIPSKKIDKDYFFHWFHLFDLNIISNGANIPQINNYSFDEVYIPYPKSLTEQQSIVQKLDALSNETKKLEAIYQQKINDLEELKKSILQKAFAGELRSPEGAGYTNDVATPIAKKKTITSPERA